VSKISVNEKIRKASELGDPDFYRTGPPWGEYDPLYNCILALILRWEPHESALDIGCYLGDFTARLAEVGVKEVVGVDVSKEAIKYARIRHPEINFIVSNIIDLELEEKFDLVTASGVLNFNHLTTKVYEQAIKKIYSLLRSEGYLIIQNPKSAMKFKERFTVKKIEKYFQLLQSIEMTKHADYAYKGRREHGKSRYIRLYKRRN